MVISGSSTGVCTRCRNYQAPDKKLFTNTWIGRNTEVVSKCYLIHRWIIASLALSFLVESIYKQALKADGWKYALYLTSWVRLLAFIQYFLEAVLVTRRWRIELQGQIELSTREGYASSNLPLPIFHRILWYIANISANVSLVSCLMYWPFFYQPGVHPLDLQNLSGHAFIPAYNIIDVFISTRPWRFLHATHSQLFCLVYALSNFAYIAEEGTEIYNSSHYMYSILDWSRPTQCLLTVFGLTILVPFLHAFFIILSKLRDMLIRYVKKPPNKDDKIQIELGRIHLMQ